MKYFIGILLVVVISSLVLASYTGFIKFELVGAGPTLSIWTSRSATTGWTQTNQLTVSLSVSGNTQNMKAGDNATFTAIVSGGQQPYLYQWTYFRNGSSPNPVIDDTNVFVFTADSWHTGTFTVTVTVHDSLGNVAFDSYTPITVIPEYTNVSIILLSLLLISVSLIVIFVAQRARAKKSSLHIKTSKCLFPSVDLFLSLWT